MRSPLVSRSLVAFIISTSIVCLFRPAQARGRKAALAGKVSLGVRALPGSKGTHRYLRALERTARGRAVFAEDRKTGDWTIHYAAVAKRPVQAARLKIYDGSRLIGSRDQMLYRRTRIVAGSLTLAREAILSPNARLRIVFETLDGRPLAQRTFYVQGREAPRRRARSRSIDFAAAEKGDDERLTVGAVRAFSRRSRMRDLDR